MENHLFRRKVKSLTRNFSCIFLSLLFAFCGCTESSEAGHDNYMQSTYNSMTDILKLLDETVMPEEVILSDTNHDDYNQSMSSPIPENSEVIVNITPDLSVYVYTYYHIGTISEFNIPHINVSPEIDALVNAEIDAIFLNRTNPLEFIEYEYSKNSSIVSVFIYGHEGFGHNGSILYAVNIDLESNTIVTLPEILTRYGYDYPTVRETHEQLTSMIPNEARNITGNPKIDFAIYDFNWNQFYINQDNHICLIGNLYMAELRNDGDSHPYVDMLYRYGILWDIETKTYLAYP